MQDWETILATELPPYCISKNQISHTNPLHSFEKPTTQALKIGIKKASRACREARDTPTRQVNPSCYLPHSQSMTDLLFDAVYNKRCQFSLFFEDLLKELSLLFGRHRTPVNAYQRQ